MSRLKPSIMLFTCVLVAGVILSAPVSRAARSGEQAFADCAACHSIDGSPNLGPTLKGIVGRASAAVPGFAYSSALKRAQLKWTVGELDNYVADPQAAVPGNVMPYAGMSDPAERAALIAYLATLK